ncbi:MAG: hypothetical protein PHI18_10280 [bacterium]|nr:hypothetical protein [bacterium]
MTVTAGYGATMVTNSADGDLVGVRIAVDAIELVPNAMAIQGVFGGWYLWKRYYWWEGDDTPGSNDQLSWAGSYQVVQLVLSRTRHKTKTGPMFGAGIGYHQQWPKEERYMDYSYEQPWGKPSTLWRGHLLLGWNIPITSRQGLTLQGELQVSLAEAHINTRGPLSLAIARLGYRFPLM